ncbi:hypothetical protein [Candidatus Harpocratesius sp.]
MPGYFFSEIFQIREKITFLEHQLLSYFIGIGFIGGIWLLTINLPINNRILIEISLIDAFATSNLLLYRKKSIGVSTNVLTLYGLGIVFLFYIGIWIVLYPDHLHIITDISDHYSLAISLGFNPSTLSDFDYIIETAFESAFISISLDSIKMNMYALLSLNFFIPISVFTAAKRIFGKEKENYAMISTFFFTLLNPIWGGLLTLISYNYTRFIFPDLSFMSIIDRLNFFTQDSFLYSIIGLWTLPNFVDLVLLFFIVAFVLNKEVSLVNITFMMVFLSTLLFLIHIPEGIIFSGFLAVYSFFFMKKNKKTKYILIGHIIGNIIAFFTFFLLDFLPIFPLFDLNLALKLGLLLPLCISTSAFLFIMIFHRFDFFKERILNHAIIGLSGIFIILFGIATVIKTIELFSIDYYQDPINTDTFSNVPWYNYSLLGLNLLLTLIAIFIVGYTKDKNIPRFLITSFYTSFFLGKLIEFINQNYYWTRYNEKRFVQFISMIGALLIPFVFEKLFLVMNKFKSIKIKIGLKVIVIFFVVISNFLFVPLVVYTRQNLANSHYSLSESEWEGIEQCENLVRMNPKVGFFALTERGKDYLVYTGNQEVIAHNQIDNRNKTLAEFKYYLTNNFETDYIYVLILYKSDREYFQSLGCDLRYFLNNSSVYFENLEVRIIGPICQKC